MNKQQFLIKKLIDKKPDDCFTVKEIAIGLNINYFKAYYILNKITGLKKFRYRNRIFFTKRFNPELFEEVKIFPSITTKRFKMKYISL